MLAGAPRKEALIKPAFRFTDIGADGQLFGPRRCLINRPLGLTNGPLGRLFSRHRSAPLCLRVDLLRLGFLHVVQPPRG